MQPFTKNLLLYIQTNIILRLKIKFMLKNTVTLVVLLVISISVYSQSATNNNTQTIDNHVVANKTTHNFGSIPQGKPVFYNFELKNNGSAPLVITDVTTTCGCTTPEWKKEPIAAGAAATVKVGYNAAAEGGFQKPITVVFANGITQVLQIEGNVWKVPVTPVPVNSSIKFLKQQSL